MKIKISNKGYSGKPDIKEMAKITNDMKYNQCVEVNFEQLRMYLSKGYSVLLASFKEKGNIHIDNIEQIECLALDIDSKENPINMFEMESLVYKKIGIIPIIKYPTFSDKNLTRFRLIYKFEEPIDAESYKLLYSALKWKLGKYIDNQTVNPNRIWAGTNKKVELNELFVEFKTNNMIRLINKYNESLKRKQKKQKTLFKKAVIDNSQNLKGFIKSDYKDEVKGLLKSNIDLKEYIEKHYGGNWKRKGSSWISKCCLPHHAGDRSGDSLSVKGTMYNCFSHCGGGDLFTIAKMVYNTNDFSEIVFNLAKEYSIHINREYIGVFKNECN